jgi:toxin YhaV
MVAHGWTFYAHPSFSRQFDALKAKVKLAAKTDPTGFENGPAAKLLSTIDGYIRETIPADPGSRRWRQGNTLGKSNPHWFRAKFHERYRLFFRFSTEQRIIVYAWVNDEGTLRKSGSKSDPYAVFEAMLESGDPPSSWEEVLKVSKEMK